MLISISVLDYTRYRNKSIIKNIEKLMALTNNWITAALSKLACIDGAYNSFDFRKLKLALQIEYLLENDPESVPTSDSSLQGFTLQWVYDQIKCGARTLDKNIIARAEAMVASALATLALIEPLKVYAAGTAYSLTAVAAALNFGTTDPVIVLPAAGKYIIRARVQYRFAGATFAAAREVTTKLRRTNNTAADISNSSTGLSTGITTTLTQTFAVVQLPEVVYETANDDDSITIFGSVAVVPTAGSLDATEASIIVERIK